MDNSYIGAEMEENDFPMEIESDMSGIVKDYDVLKNKPTIDGNTVYGDITRSGRYTDEIPTDGSKKLLTSGDAKKALDAKSDQDHTHGEYLKKEDVPEIPSVPENVSAFNNDVGYVTESEMDAALSQKSDASHTHGEYLKKEDIPEVPRVPENVSAFNNDVGYVTGSEMDEVLSEKSDTSHTHPHNHDERYYTKDNIDSMMEGSALSGHNHDSRYYTEEETDNLLAEKSDKSHTHSEYAKKEEIPVVPGVPENVSEFNNDAGYVTGLEMNSALLGKSDAGHTHTEYLNASALDAAFRENKEILIINVTPDFNNNTVKNISHSFDEITQAYNNGNSVFLHADMNGTYVFIPLSIFRSDDYAIFTTTAIDETGTINFYYFLLSNDLSVSSFTYIPFATADLVSEARLEALNLLQNHNHDDLYSKKTDFSGLQKDVAANSSSIADIRNECDSLEEQLGSVEQKQNTQALSLQLISKSVEKIMDCVVEEGVSGSWTYRKWYSGIAECWGVFNTTYSTSVAEGGNYALTAAVIRVDLPENLFSKSPVIELTPMGGGYPSVVIANIYNTNFTFTIRTEWAVNNMPIWLQVRCIG